MDKEAYTHHVIKAKLFSPSAIRCELIGKKTFTQIVNIVHRSAQSKNNIGYRNTNNLKIQKQYRLRCAACGCHRKESPGELTPCIQKHDEATVQ